MTKDQLKKFIVELEEENKKLKEENVKLRDRILTDENFEEKQGKEIKSLKEIIEHYKKYEEGIQKLEGMLKE